LSVVIVVCGQVEVSATN